MDTREDPVDIVLEDDVDWMETAEGILKQWSLEKEIPSLQGRLAESTRLVEGWNLEHIDPLSTLKVNVLIWSMRAFMDEVFGANWVSRIPSQNVEFGTISIAEAMSKLEEETSRDGHVVRLLNNLTFDVEDGAAENDGDTSLSDMDEVLEAEFPLLYGEDVAQRGYLGISISVDGGYEESLPVTTSAGNGCGPQGKAVDIVLEDDKGRPLLESMRSNCQDGSFRFQEIYESEEGVPATGNRHSVLLDAFRTEESGIEEYPRGISQGGLLASMRNIVGKLNTQLESPVLNDRDNEHGDAVCTPNVVPESQTENTAQDAAHQAMAMLHSDPALGVPAEKEPDEKQEKKAARQKRLADERKQHYLAVMAPRDVSRPDIGSSLEDLKTTRRVSSKAKSPTLVDKGTEEPILSGLDISTECFAPTCTGKESTVLDEDETVPERRSTRLQSKKTRQKTDKESGDETDTRSKKKKGGISKNTDRSSSPERRKRGRDDRSVPDKPQQTANRTPKRSRRNSSTMPAVSPKVLKKEKGQKSASTAEIDFSKPPEKVGCPKCRFRGCRKCRGYTLAELRQWEQLNSQGIKKDTEAIPNLSGTTTKHNKKQKGNELQILHGYTFLVTILDKSLKRTVAEEITSLGGKIEDNLSNILKDSGGNVRTRKSPADQSKMLLVTNNVKNKTIKAILARVAGIAFVTPGWVHACKVKNSVDSLSPRSPNVLLGRNTEGMGPVLQDLRILLVIDKKNTATKMFGSLLKHLGATLVPGLDPELGHGACDLVLYDSSSDIPDLKAEIHRIERIARRLRIPSYPLSWLTDGIVSEGKFSPPPPSLDHQEMKEIVPTVIPGTEDDESEKESRQVSIGAKVNQSQDQHLGNRNYTPALAMRSNSKQKSQDNREVPPTQGGATLISSLLREPAHTDPSSMNVVSEWTLMDPCDPPDGFKKSPIRQYFKTAISEDEKIMIDDFVKLLPDPGRGGPKIAQVVALWKQTGMPDGNKMFGKFKRYYRFNETSITVMQITKEDGSNRIFKTNHCEDNLPLAAIISKCNVEILQSPMVSRDMLTEDDQASIDPMLYCTAFYDYETGAILPLHE